MSCLGYSSLFLGQNHPRPALRRAKKEAKEIAIIAASQVMHFDPHPEMIAITIKDCQLAVFPLMVKPETLNPNF